MDAKNKVKNEDPAVECPTSVLEEEVHLRRNNDDDGMFDMATEIFNRMLFMAATIPHNYIIDERKNVYLNTGKDMLKPFADFQKVAVVVFPQLKELYRRSEKRFKEIGKVVLADNVKDMIANFVLPKSKDMPSTDEDEDECFDEVAASQNVKTFLYKCDCKKMFN